MPLPPSLSLYRYSQLIYLTLIGKRNNLPYLRRDAILVRFFHCFLSSAPHLVIHLYATMVALTSSSSSLDAMDPSILTALAVSTVSVLYTVLSFATNDRVSGKTRHVVLPGHITQAMWHLCMVTSRVLALVLFACVFGYYVVAVVGGHWLLMIFLLLLERTTFCADIERQSNGELKFTRRLCLEIPFDLVAASVYVFAYFNPKRGRTRVWAGIYHLVTLAENVTMGVLMYLSISTTNLPFSKSPTDLPFSQFPVVSLSLVIGLYPLGLVFMFCYYLLYHPKRTGNCFWIGIPKNCCRCCCKGDQNEDSEVVGTKYQNRNSRVIISEPTLVSHNGYVPKNLLPVGPNAAAMMMVMNQNETRAVSQSQSTANGRGHACRDRSLTEPKGRWAGRMAGQQRCGSGGVTSPDSSHTNTAPHIASESNLALELDTDISGSNVPVTNDTVIDTPLFGHTPEVSAMSDSRRAHVTLLVSQDNDSQKAYTNDTGIDVDSDLQLSPGTVGGDMEDMNQVVGGALCPSGEEPDEGQGGHKDLRLPLFVDAPIKREKLHRNGLEQHYFPDKHNPSPATHRSARDTVALHSRDSVTPTLPTPTYSPTPPSPTPNSTLPGGKWNSDDESEDVFRHGDSSSSPTMQQRGTIVAPQYPSPERQRKAPRSPIGARSHQISTATEHEEAFSCSQQSSHSQTGPRAVTPRSPKGARRLLIQQSPPTSPAQSKPHRQAPRPPVPPKATSLKAGGDTPAVNVTASMEPVSSQQHVQPQIARPIPIKTPTTTAQQMPPRSDGLTRGLMSLVPMPEDRRAQSSSPFPVPHQHHVPGGAPKYSRALSYHATGSTASPARLSRGVANYRQSDNGLDSKVKGGSLHSMQHYHAQPRPKSEGWHMDKSTVLSPRGRGMTRQAPLNSHGSSPERSSHSSSSSGQNWQQQSHGANTQQQCTNAQRRSYNPQYPGTPKATPPHHAHAPKSAFMRVSPERNHTQHVGGAGGWHSQRSEGYPSPHPASMGGPPSTSLSKSPRHYPKIPQGAPTNAPKMVRSPASNRNLPPPIPPPRREYHGSSSIDEPLTDLNSSSHAHSLGASSSKDSGNYDKLPAEIQNRNSFLSPTTLRPPQSSTHESTV